MLLLGKKKICMTLMSPYFIDSRVGLLRGKPHKSRTRYKNKNVKMNMRSYKKQYPRVIRYIKEE